LVIAVTVVAVIVLFGSVDKPDDAASNGGVGGLYDIVVCFVCCSWAIVQVVILGLTDCLADANIKYQADSFQLHRFSKRCCYGPINRVISS
jgi:hypothetical protein